MRKIKFLYYGVHEALYLTKKFMTSESGVQALGLGQYGHIVKMYLILENVFDFVTYCAQKPIVSAFKSFAFTIL